MNIFIIFHILSLLEYWDKHWDKYPIIKKKTKDAIEAPTPNNIFWLRIKFFEKLPKKNTVSEYTCGFKYVKPRVFNNILNFEISGTTSLKFTFKLKDLIFE